MLTKFHAGHRISTHWLPLAIIIAAASYYFRFLYQHALNVPFEDEIFDVLKFMSAVVRSENWQETLQLFLNNYNVHRTASSRLVYYLAYRVEGIIDFRTLVFLASLALPLLLGLFYLRIRERQYRWLLLLPCAFLLFQLRASGLAFWSMSAFAFFYAILYGFCCIYFLHCVNYIRFLLAIMCAILATFSLASGQLIWLVGFVSLLHQGYVLKSAPKRYSLYWLVPAIAALLVWYFAPWSFEPLPLWAPPEVRDLGATPLSLLLHSMKFFLVLLGSFAGNVSLLFAGFAGVLSLLGLAWVSVTSRREQDIRLELCWWYVVLTMAAVAVARAYFLNLEYALESRYSFLSTIMIATVWILIAEKVAFRSPIIPFVVASAAGVYLISSYAMYSAPCVSAINTRIQSYNRSNFPAMGHKLVTTRAIVAEARSLGVYRGPRPPIPIQQNGIDYSVLD